MSPLELTVWSGHDGLIFNEYCLPVISKWDEASGFTVVVVSVNQPKQYSFASMCRSGRHFWGDKSLNGVVHKIELLHNGRLASAPSYKIRAGGEGRV